MNLSRRRRGFHWLRAAAALLAAAMPATSASGQCESAVLSASEGASEDYFGAAVAIDDGVAIVGAPQSDAAASNGGSACIFRRDLASGQWIEEAVLTAAAPSAGQFFGFAVSIRGSLAVVGAWGDDSSGTNAGAAYIFRLDPDTLQWEEETKLLASDGAEGDRFGYSVALTTGIVLIGAPQMIPGGPGAAYLFEETERGWSEQPRLVASDGADTDQFGIAVAVDGSIALVGAEEHDGRGIDSGAAYVFARDGGGWPEQARLTAFDAAAGARFGHSVAVRADAAVIGAHWDAENGFRAGAAYVFRLSPREMTWTEEAKLLASDAAPDEQFGYSVSLDSDTTAIGARWDDEAGYHAGAAYLFALDSDARTWQEQAKLSASDIAAEDKFGFAVSVRASSVAVGAFAHDTAGQSDRGAAYIFDLAGADCNGNGVCDWRDILDGTSSDVNGNGVPDECENLCPWDVWPDGVVGIDDLVLLINHWGPCADPGDCPWDCEAEPDGEVGIDDLVALINHWGPC